MIDHHTGESLQTIFNKMPCLWRANRKASALQEMLFYTTPTGLIANWIINQRWGKVKKIKGTAA